VTAPATATFTVTATGNPAPTYQWNLDGAAISNANLASYTTPATTTAMSGGSFTVTLSNSSGHVTSTPAILTVNASGPASGTVKVARTGQTVVFAPGDDGSLQKGVASPSPRFTNADGSTPVNSSGVALDQLTGLMWTVDASGPAVSGSASGPMTWTACFAYIANLNAKTYLGFSDWRLPNMREIRTLMDYSQGNPALPAGNPFTNALSASMTSYWTSTTVSNTNKVFTINSYDGNISSNYTSAVLLPWPVRAGQTAPGAAPAEVPRTGQATSYQANDDGALKEGVAWPSPRFTNPDGTVVIGLVAGQ
jgi:hypothetical protein